MGEELHAKVQVVRQGMTPATTLSWANSASPIITSAITPLPQGRTLGLEERIEMKLKEGDKSYAIQGYIDRLTWDPVTETYEIHDYKTGSAVPTQQEADEDRQLALYQMGIKQRWPDAKRVKLIWHYLATDKEIVSSRTEANLATLEREVIDVIHQIEEEAKLGRWDVRVSRLCDWCEYKSICPAWKPRRPWKPSLRMNTSRIPVCSSSPNTAELEARKADHQADIKNITQEQAKIEEAALAYAKKEDLLSIDGPEHRLVIKNEDEFRAPPNRKTLLPGNSCARHSRMPGNWKMSQRSTVPC